MNGQNREDIYPGRLVDIVLKRDQPTGKLTRGYVKDVLTHSKFHPRGIKVRLELTGLDVAKNGTVRDEDIVGRVQEIIE